MARYDMNDVKPDLVVEGITDEQCDSLKNNTGLDPNEGKNNCEVFNEELIPLLAQEINAILKGSDINIYANDESKCADDGLPTHASMWSRIYRFSQALTCILCAYDPFLATLLKSGRYPQVLMAAENSEYPVWQTPDTLPRKGAQVPITSDGVYRAIQDAILSVWHLWEEYPEFAYYFVDIAERDAQTGMADGDFALVRDGENGNYNVIYSYNETAQMWVEEEIVGVDLPNFTVTHFTKGKWAGKELYYMKSGTDPNAAPVWSIMDAHLEDLEMRLDAIESRINTGVVLAQDGQTNYLLTTRPTLNEAIAVPVTAGKTTITLITG